MIRLSLQARQEALSTAVLALLVQNNESEQQAGRASAAFMRRVERNVYCFLAAMLILIVLTSLYLVQYNRRLFEQVAELSRRRSELAQQLIAMQENTFRSISRELHDDFGQILTAIGAMLQRTSGAPRRPRLGPRRSARDAGGRAVHARKSALRCPMRCTRWCWTKPVSKAPSTSIPARLPEADRHRGALRKDRRRPRARSRCGHPSVSRAAGGAEQRGASIPSPSRRRCACVTCRTPWCSKWRIAASASAKLAGIRNGAGLHARARRDW